MKETAKVLSLKRMQLGIMKKKDKLNAIDWQIRSLSEEQRINLNIIVMLKNAGWRLKVNK